MIKNPGVKSVLNAIAMVSLLLVNQSSAFTFQNQNPTFAVRFTDTASSPSAMSMSSSSTATDTTVTGGIKLKGSPTKDKMPIHERNGPVFAVHSIDEFLNQVENTKENELVFVKFHAKWCRVCARAVLKYKKMAHKYESSEVETPVPIKFISVECTVNPKIIEQLGIKKFPYLQIYRNKECVASFGTGPARNFQKVVGSTVEQKLNTDVSEWDAFRSEFKTEISSGLENLELLEAVRFTDTFGSPSAMSMSSSSPATNTKLKE